MQNKKAGQWLLRFQTSLQSPSQADEAAKKSSSKNNFPILTKFPDPVEWQHYSQRNSNQAYLYYQDEELKEDDNDEQVVKDAEYYKKKRANRMRRYYKKKKLLIFECPNEGIFYEGKENNVDIGDGVVDRKAEANLHNEVQPDFHYVLFKFVKKEENGQDVPEIQVIPVSSMYTLRKIGKLKDELLHEIEDKYVEEKKILQKNLSKYKHIVSALHRDREAGADGDRRPELVDEVGETDMFKQALHKAFGLKALASRRRGGGGGGRGSGVDLSEGGGGDGAPGVQLNEAGVDPDELKEFAFLGGDYETRFADDEEDHVVLEQLAINRMEEDEFAKSFKDDENLSERDEEEDDDEDHADGQAANAGGGNSLGLVGSESGFVDQQMLYDAQHAAQHLKKQQEQQAQAQAQQRPLKSALKRSRESLAAEEENFEITNDNDGLLPPQTSGANPSALPLPLPAGDGRADKKKAKISFAAAEVANSAPAAQSAMLVPAAATIPPTSAAAADGKYELSEEGVRSYIQNRGGRVAIKEISQVSPTLAITLTLPRTR